MRFFALIISIMLLVISGCSINSDTGKKTTGSQSTPDYAQGMEEISKCMSSKHDQVSTEATDFAAIDSLYHLYFSTLAKNVNPRIDAEIDSAIDRGKRNEDVDIQKQWIAKNLQGVVYHGALKELAKLPGDNPALVHAAKLIQCIEPIIERREKWLNTGTLMRDEVNLELSRLKNATPDQVPVHIQNIRHLLNKVYLLCVIWETKGLKAARGGASDNTEIKRVEGFAYYNVIAPEIGDTAVRNVITAEWQKTPDNIDIELIKTSLAAGLPLIWKELPDSIRNF